MAGDRAAELVEGVAAEIEAWQQPYRGSVERLDQTGGLGRGHQVGVGVQREQRLQLGVQDHLPSEAVLPDPEPSADVQQQSLAQSAQSGSGWRQQDRPPQELAGPRQSLGGYS